jgi:hypothetical protein
MFAAYAIIYTTPFVIVTLATIGFVCLVVGKYRARYLWDVEDAACDVLDERKYKEKQRINKLVKIHDKSSYRPKDKFSLLVDEYNRLVVITTSRQANGSCELIL